MFDNKYKQQYLCMILPELTMKYIINIFKLSQKLINVNRCERLTECFPICITNFKVQAGADHLQLSVKTVETYCSRIKEKMHYENINELIQHAANWASNSSII